MARSPIVRTTCGGAALALACTAPAHAGGLGGIVGFGGVTYERIGYTVTPNAAAVEAADLNADGINDLIVRGEQLAILLGIGDRAFTAPTLYDLPVGTNATTYSRLALGDLNGDGLLDVFVGGEHGAVYLGDGAGGLAAPIVVLKDGLSRPGWPVLGDIDEDGDLDLAAVPSTDGGEFSIWRNDGTGALTFDTAHDGQVAMPAVALADLNADGHLDLIGGSMYDTIVVRLGDGAGNFPVKTTFGYAGPSALDMADVDGDGDLDAVLGSNLACPGFSYNAGDGAYTTYDCDNQGTLAGEIRAADLDGDGDPDAAQTSSFGGPLLLLENADGTPVAGPKIWEVDGGRGLTIADLGGGTPLPEIIVGVSNMGGVVILWALPPTSCPADLDGSGAVDSTDLNTLLGAFGSTDGGDIDGDGDTDSADLNRLLAAFGDDCAP